MIGWHMHGPRMASCKGDRVAWRKWGLCIFSIEAVRGLRLSDQTIVVQGLKLDFEMMASGWRI
jgi:hypothetical protein